MDDLRPESISSNTSSPISQDMIEPNWIVKLFKDNLKGEIPSIVDCKLIFDILVKVRLQLRLRREESEKWLKLYNKQVEDDRHIENQRDELNAEIIELKKEISLLKAKSHYDIIKIN